ncbi:MAG: hypothetical protein N2V73_06655 [Candidatus Methanospirare jalkutatii]|nr:hypothetical protein [Candidatus Methanospirare jalkutatii]MCW7080202.1 hypothetical protein [Candidatus Methanospirare jalkutatii]
MGKREARRENFAVCSKKEAEEKGEVVDISNQRSRKIPMKSLVVVYAN